MSKKLTLYLIVLVISFSIAFGYLNFIVGSKYSSTAVIYPTSTLNPEFLMEAGLRFGDEKELNELIEILNSHDVAVKVLLSIHKGKLANFSDSEISILIQDLEKNTSIERGINRSVSITVLHEDPNLAASIANSYCAAAHEHFSELLTKSVEQQCKVSAQMYADKLNEVNILRDTLEKLESLGESKVVGMVLVNSPRYRLFDHKFENEMNTLAKLKYETERLNGIIKKDAPQLFVVSKAVASNSVNKKSILVRSGLFALMSFLFFAAIRNRKRFFGAAL